MTARSTVTRCKRCSRSRARVIADAKRLLENPVPSVRNNSCAFVISVLLGLVMLAPSFKARPASPQPASVQDKGDPKWIRCQNDRECAVSFGPCGEWAGVNAKFIKEQQAWAVKKGSAIGCPQNRSPKPTVGCRAQVCITVP